MNTRFGTLLIGPRQHGVVIFGHRIADALPPETPRQWAPDVATVLDGGVTLGNLDLVHVHFTDQLFADRCERSAAQFVRLAAAVRRQAGAEMTVTLHDIPYAEADTARFARRTAAYSAVIEACAGRVIVSSEHEAARVRAFHADCRPTVIPLPIVSPPDVGPAHSDDAEVTVIGFIYPGKGHAEAIRAVRHLPDAVGVTALGRATEQHGDLRSELQDLSESIGRRFTVTGFVPEPDFTRRLRTAAIPLAAHSDISASGSIASWLGAGRRPLVPDGPYTRELEERCPRSVTRYPPGEAALANALATALAHPRSTWLDADVELYPNPAEVGRLLSDALTDVRHFSMR